MTEAEKAAPLHERFLEGMTLKRRPDGTVITIKGENGRTVGECCVGKSKTRINFKHEVPKDQLGELQLEGTSNSWKGGGFVLGEGNLELGRTVMQAVIAAAQPTAEEAAAASEEAEAAKNEAEEALGGKGVKGAKDKKEEPVAAEA